MVKVVDKSKSSALAVRAKSNTTVAKKSSGETEVIVQGTPLDHAPKHGLPVQVNEPRQMVGLSKGVTVSMGDYQSLRVDCWLMDFVEQGESQQESLDRLSKVIDDRINMEVSEYSDLGEPIEETKPKNRRNKR